MTQRHLPCQRQLPLIFFLRPPHLTTCRILSVAAGALADVMSRPSLLFSLRATRCSSLRPSPFRASPFSFFRMASTLPRLPILEALSKHDPASPSIIHSDSGHTFSYGNLLRDVSTARDNLHQIANGKSLDGARVAFIIETSYDYVGTLPCNLVLPLTPPLTPSSHLPLRSSCQRRRRPSRSLLPLHRAPLHCQSGPGLPLTLLPQERRQGQGSPIRRH